MMHLESEKPLLLAGDWHGSFAQAARVLDYAKDHGGRLVFQLGDFGIWHNDKPYLNKLSERLERNGQSLYFVDGNHEDFPRLYAKPLHEDGTRKVRENIVHLPRGFRFKVNDTSFLALGGAASIDRKYRVLDRSYWEEELITDEDAETAMAGGYADVMLCHDSPASAPNSITDDALGQMRAGISFGPENLRLCDMHRQQLDRVVQAVRPRFLFHGHYHEFMTGDIRYHDGTRTTVTGLDEGVARLRKHTALLPV
jgi:predicted phosphodiesterase